jgi:hypothetical protein
MVEVFDSASTRCLTHLACLDPIENTASSKCSAEKKNTGRGSQVAGHQDEVIGGKPPVVK